MATLDIKRILTEDSIQATGIDIDRYAQALHAYVEASVNIRHNGVICAHPRTGTPMENPYFRVQRDAGNTLGKIPSVNGDRALEALEKHLEAQWKDKAQDREE